MDNEFRGLGCWCGEGWARVGVTCCGEGMGYTSACLIDTRLGWWACCTEERGRGVLISVGLMDTKCQVFVRSGVTCCCDQSCSWYSFCGHFPISLPGHPDSAASRVES